MNILKPINQCSLTGLEKRMFNNSRNYTTFRDNYGGIRILFNHVRVIDGVRNLTPICGLLLEKNSTKDYTISHVYTITSERRRGYARMLLRDARVRFNTIRHSENLTESGSLWMNNVEGLTQ